MTRPHEADRCAADHLRVISHAWATPRVCGAQWFNRTIEGYSCSRSVRCGTTLSMKFESHGPLSSVHRDA